MALLEYLYVDTPRVDAYLEQFAAPVAYDKVPTWKAGISFTGPEVGVSQDRYPRTRTTHEKVDLLLNHLRKTDQMSEGRAGPADLDKYEVHGPKPFRLETCTSTRAFLVSNVRPTAPQPQMALWYSEPLARGTGSLLLMEDFAGDDRPAQFRVGTPCSALFNLMQEMHDQLRETIIDPDATRSRDVETAIRFTPGVTEVLRQLGARLGPARNITTLYRVRALFSEDYEGTSRRQIATGTIGYPIFIREA